MMMAKKTINYHHAAKDLLNRAYNVKNHRAKRISVFNRYNLAIKDVKVEICVEKQ